MISVRVRGDIQPFCDRHPNRVMTFIFLQLVPGVDKPWQPAFVCDEPGCPRHFNPTYGYFNTFKGRVDPDTLRRLPCPHDALPLYVAATDEAHGMWTWRCAQFGCDGVRIAAGAPAKSAKA